MCDPAKSRSCGLSNSQLRVSHRGTISNGRKEKAGIGGWVKRCSGKVKSKASHDEGDRVVGEAVLRSHSEE